MHAAAHDVKKLAASHSLILFALQPFAGYDALVPGDRLEHRFKDGLLWLECCKIMSIQIMQVSLNEWVYIMLCLNLSIEPGADMPVPSD